MAADGAHQNRLFARARREMESAKIEKGTVCPDCEGIFHLLRTECPDGANLSSFFFFFPFFLFLLEAFVLGAAGG